MSKKLIDDMYPLSPMQEGMLYHYIANRNTKEYFEQITFELKGAFDLEKFELAWNYLIQSCGVLRTIFQWREVKKPIQIVLKKRPMRIEFIDLSHVLDQKEQRLAEIKANDLQAGFDLERGPLTRITVCRFSDEKHVLIWSFHHIILDGWSMAILMKDIFLIYNQLLQGQTPQFAPKFQYKEYIRFLVKQDQNSAKQYWHQYLQNFTEPTYLPTDFPKRSMIENIEEQIFSLDVDQYQKLQQIAKQYDVTVNVIFQIAWGIVLRKYTFSDDVVFGATVSGRPHELDGISESVGLFINTVPVRINRFADQTIVELLQRHMADSFERQDYEYLSLTDIHAQSELSGQSPLFDHIIVFENYPVEESLTTAHPHGLEIVNTTSHEMTNFDLTVIVMMADTLKVRLNYNKDIFKAETISRLSAHFSNILHSIITNPEVRVSELIMLSPKEMEQLLQSARGSEQEYEQKCIHQRFEDQVEKTPDAIALIFEGYTLTYRELNQRANNLARQIQKQAVVPDTIVGIMVDRSLEMVIGILAILKAGGAYLPIDPQYPNERIEYMLQESEAKILLTQDDCIDDIDFSGTTINIQDQTVYSGDGTNLANVNTPQDLVYVIFTSGSTGKPKGVMIEHQNVANLIQFEHAKTNVDYRTKILQFASISFDVSFQEIFSTLLAGGQLYLVSQERRDQIPKLFEYVDEEGIEVLFLPTALVKYIFSETEYSGHLPESVKHIIAAGEQLIVSAKLREYIQKHQIFLHNHYGPSETHVVTTLTMSPNKEIADLPTIGRPIDNTQIYIVDRDRQLQPRGIMGELCIGGKSVGRGYLHRADFTEEKFIPFIDGTRLYRTGDIARWKEDGTIEFLGRMDQQVKIRGFRIELGEIEGALLNHKQLREVVVIDHKDDQNNRCLVAYYVADSELTVSEFRDFLSQKLPDYMIPGYFIKLTQIPLTSNGKVNRRALPKPDGKIVTGAEFVAPRNAVEERLSKIWAELLQVEKVGILDHFFELGGHSLKATVLTARIFKEFNVEIPVQQIFKTPTVQALAAVIGTTQKSVYASIEPVEERNCYPVSSAQKRLFILHQFEPQSTNYNMPGAMYIEGELDPVAFCKAFEELIQRHESLRTSFHTLDGEIIQIVHQTVDFAVLRDATTEENLNDVIADFIKPFDLSQAPLLRVGLIKLAERYLFLYDLHHIISDGVSMNLIITDFINLYQGKELPELRIQYKDFAVWQNALFQSEQIHEQEKYWLETFAGTIPVLNLPTDYPRPVVMSFEGATLTFEIGQMLTDQLKQLALHHGATLYMVLLAAYNLLLAKYTGQEDIVVGSPIAGRPHADLEKIIGMFVNTLAMRNTLQSNHTFVEYLATVKEKAVKAYENQDYPFEKLVEQLHLERDLSKNPLFDTAFAFLNTDRVEIVLDNLKFIPYQFAGVQAKLDLTLHAGETAHGIHYSFEYCTELFKQETIARLAKHYVHLLQTIIAHPEWKLAEMELISELEKSQILNEFNNTFVEYPKTKTIHQLFEEQVQLRPEKVAVAFEGVSMSYQVLNAKANQLARVLRAKGVGREQVVAIMSDKSLEAIIGVLAIIKAGGAYLPIDIEYPPTRVEYMLNDAGAQLLLTQRDFVEKYQFAGETIDLADAQLYQGDDSNLEQINQPDDLIYIIYTSGSTGNPKGVMVQHINVNRLISNSNMLTITDSERILQIGSLAFDASTYEIWSALLNGASLYLIRKDDLLSPERFEAKMKEYHITIALLTTPVFNQMIEENPAIFAGLKALIIGGDALSPKHINFVRTLYPALCVINGYGPTENTTFTTYFKMDQEHPQTNYHNIPIGKPLSNTKVYIVDDNTHLQPTGVPGELCVSGDGLARGYLNRPELTAEKFIPNPFEPPAMMYRTGDLARWLSDGNIEFMGRIDQQVKIRGFRIELGEIENQLLQYPELKEVVVVVRKDQAHEKYLCAYLVKTTENTERDGNELSSSDIRAFLQKRLPEYMIPAYFVQLDQLPLTPNGKVDRKALPEVDEHRNTHVTYVAPSNEIEAKLVQIWSELLDIKPIGILDNFFELGGHSLKATSFVAKAFKEFHVQIPLREVFLKQTIKELAEYIKESEQNIYSSIVPVMEREYYAVSSAQKRLYILHQFQNQSTNYNMPGVIYIEGDLDRAALDEAFDKLIHRHESLRTSFHTVHGEFVQKVHPTVEFAIQVQKATEADLPEVIANFIRPFDLNQAPLLRVGLIQLAERHVLLYDMHHIISDGVSMNLIITDLINLYQGKELPALCIQYKDYAAWQNDLLQSVQVKKQEEYWLETLAGEIPLLDLPTDYSRPGLPSFKGAVLNFEIGHELTEQLKQFASNHGATLYMVFLTAYNLLLAKYTGQEDIVVGSPIAGRPHPDLEKIIGMFVNTLAMRNAPTGEKTVSEFLAEVRERSLKAYEHQNYPFEMLVEKLDIKRNASRNPLFDTMFAMQNLDHKEMITNDLRFMAGDIQTNAAKFDLELHAVEADESIIAQLIYSTDLFSPATMERLSKHFTLLIQGMVANPETKIADLALISQAEKEQLLYQFNDTKVEFPETKTICQWFEEQVARTPDQIAVIFTDHHYTYQEFNEQANQLARVLRKQGVTRDDVVAIMLQRSLEMILGIFAILKAGGAYLPIAPEYPTERIALLLEDSQAKILLTAGPVQNDLRFVGEVLDLSDAKLYSAEQADNLPYINYTNDLAYVIYTSGSTGTPKGVMIEHRSVANRLHWMQRKYSLNAHDIILQKTPFTFDVSVWELLIWSMVGAKVCFLEPEGEKEPGRIVEAIDEFQITTIHFVPSMLTAFLSYLESFPEKLEKLASLQRVFASGEELKPSQVRDFNYYLNKAYGTVLSNLYGPTEASIDVTYFDCFPEQNLDVIPIGKPIDNTQLYILNPANQLQPIGIVGELHIGGIGLARGYLNREDLTEEKFISSPFAPGERIYKTGDLARWLVDGNIEYVGRMDGQVKIRGYRIELGEIEARLLEHETIIEAVVVVRNDRSAEPYITAYVVSETVLSASELRKHLLQRLPEFMLPLYFVQLDQIPLTSNGKVDRKALPDVGWQRDTETEYVAPTNELEERLVNIWSEILDVEKIGITDHFFALGGHSLKATKLIARLHKEFNVEMSLQDIFQRPTVADLAQLMQTRKRSIYHDIAKVPASEYYELSFSQQRLWIIHQLEPESIAYNMPLRITLSEEIDQKLIQQVIHILVDRHESLRTIFKVVEGDPVQQVLEELELPFRYVDLSRLSDAEREVERAKIDLENTQKSFNLEEGPLFRATLIKAREDEFDLIFVMHHIISDGWSIEVLQREFMQCYEALKMNHSIALPDLPIQYKDFAAWQNQLLRDEGKLQEVLSFWSEQFKDGLPILRLPYNSSPADLKDRTSAGYRLVISAEVQATLKKLATELNVSLFMILLASYNLLLARITSQTDLILGIPAAGREHENVRNIIGFFINTMILRTQVNPDEPFVEYVKSVQKSTLQALQYQAYPLELIFTRLKMDYPRISTFFNMLNFQEHEPHALENLEPYHMKEVQEVKFDFVCYMMEFRNGIEVNCHYLTGLFDPETIEYIMGEYLNLLKRISEDPERNVKEYIAPKKRQKILC